MSENEEPRVPWHLMGTWGVQVGEDRVEVSPDVTVATIRGQLPTELLEEFDECVATTPLRYLGVLLSAWALPPATLQAYRRHQAGVYYRSAAVDPDGVTIPADLDVNEVMRTQGTCLLGTGPEFLPVDAFSRVRSDET